MTAIQSMTVRHTSPVAFERHDKIDINNPRYILDIVNKPEYVLPKTPNALCLYYVVTALDRVKNESLPSAPAMYK